MPSGILIHTAIWPQQIWAENWGLCPFGEGELGRSPIFEFLPRKAITRVQPSLIVDISRNSNGHISVLRDAAVTWLGKLLVLDVLCMLM